jgi:hypothetical protein
MASKYRKKFSLPENFYPILEDYSREVLRDQPIDIVEFSYLYFKAMEEVSPVNISFRAHSIRLITQGKEKTYPRPRRVVQLWKRSSSCKAIRAMRRDTGMKRKAMTNKSRRTTMRGRITRSSTKTKSSFLRIELE